MAATLNPLLTTISVPSSLFTGIRGLGGYTVYCISVHTKTPTEETKDVLERRYTHFNELHTSLCQDVPEVRKYEFPPKRVLLKNGQEFVERRRRMLEKYLQRIFYLHAVREHATFRVFMSYGDLHEGFSTNYKYQTKRLSAVSRVASINQEIDAFEVITKDPFYTHPKVTAARSFQSSTPGDLSVNAGQEIAVIEEGQDFFIGRLEDGSQGRVPSFVTTATATKVDEPQTYTYEAVDVLDEAVAMSDYSGEGCDHSSAICFKLGEIIKLYEWDDNEEWWLGSVNDGNVGYFPKFYARRLGPDDYENDWYKPDICQGYTFDSVTETWINPDKPSSTSQQKTKSTQRIPREGTPVQASEKIKWIVSKPKQQKRGGERKKSPVLLARKRSDPKPIAPILSTPNTSIDSVEKDSAATQMEGATEDQTAPQSDFARALSNAKINLTRQEEPKTTVAVTQPQTPPAPPKVQEENTLPPVPKIEAPHGSDDNEFGDLPPPPLQPPVAPPVSIVASVSLPQPVLVAPPVEKDAKVGPTQFKKRSASTLPKQKPPSPRTKPRRPLSTSTRAISVKRPGLKRPKKKAPVAPPRQ